MVEWLERAFAMRNVSGSVPSRGGHKTLEDVWDLLTPSVSAGLSKNSGYMLLTHDTKPKPTQHSLQTLYTLEMDLGPFPTAVTHFLPNDE